MDNVGRQDIRAAATQRRLAEQLREGQREGKLLQVTHKRAECGRQGMEAAAGDVEGPLLQMAEQGEEHATTWGQSMRLRDQGNANQGSRDVEHERR